MKSNAKKLSILLIISISFAFVSNKNFNSSEIQNVNFNVPKKTGEYTVPFIHIDGSNPKNWSWTVGNYSWCYFDNGYYIIENVTIDASTSPTGSGIYIENSKKDYFIIKNCSIYNSGTNHLDAGIKLKNTNNGTIFNNTCLNNQRSGIVLYLNCFNNTIMGNTVNDNTVDGIYLYENCDNNTISNNFVNYNEEYGITIHSYCDNNVITGNEAISNGEVGIELYDYCDNSTISNNNANYNGNYGISLNYDSTNNIIFNNKVNNNNNTGIYFESDCDYNNITGNIVNDNILHGIYIHELCDYNLIINNTAKNNSDTGIYLFGGGDESSYNNSISKNIVKDNNYGIRLEYLCYFNNITENIISNNMQDGIRIISSNNNTISQNIIKNHNNVNVHGIFLLNSIDNIVSGNKIHHNYYGIYLERSDYNKIFGNKVNINANTGVFMDDGDDKSDYNLIYYNFFIDNGIHAIDQSANIGNTWNNTEIGNYWDNHTGPDIDPIDGIVDIPYNITGSAGSRDYLPIAENGPPMVIINSPNTGDLFGSSSPSFNVIITDTLLNIMWYTLDGGLHNYTFIENGIIEQSAWDAMPDGEISLKFYASDIPGNIGSAEVNIIKDSQAPSIIIIYPSTNLTFGETSPSFNISVSDPHLDTIWYSLDGGITNYIITANGTINQTAWAALAGGSVTITFYANDTLGHITSEEVNVIKTIPEGGLDPTIITIIVVLSIVVGVAIIVVVYLILKKRKAEV